METRFLTLLGIFLVIVICIALGACAVVNHPRFGELPKGDRLDSIQRSPNYRDDKFQNLVPTPKFSEDVSMISMIWKGMFDRADRLVPDSPLPAVKTDLKALSPEKDAVIWMGHSSWFIQLDGKRILIDPILSDYAAPFSFINKAFPGTSIYNSDDIPEIDCLIISHDHWDHLDYSTVTALKSKVKQVICPLGVGAYFEYWGYSKNKISEGDWYDTIELTRDIIVHVLPARHYSGRLFKESKTLWAGFAFITPDKKIFYSGDSGYGTHFSKIGKMFKGFNLALMDCGQYDSRWAYIHMTPEEALKAAEDLGAGAFVPTHVGRFSIANHAWDEPFKRLAQTSTDKSYRLLTPRIGELTVINDKTVKFPRWWIDNGRPRTSEK